MLTFYLSILESDSDKSSFEKFYEKHKLRCLHIACKVTGGNQAMAEDALHNAFLVIIKDWKNFSALSGGKQLSRFVIIVKNKAIDLMREAKRKDHNELDDENNDSADEASEVSIIVENNEGYKSLLGCISELPEIYKVVFELRFIQDSGNNEIAGLLGITPRTVSMRLHRARFVLQDKLIKEGLSYGRK